MATLRLVLAEDNLLVREGLRRLFDDADGIEVVAVCVDLDTLLEAVEKHRPAVVVTDIRMPPSHTDEGIQAARRWRREHVDVGVVVLSQFVASAYALNLLEGGSRGRGYVLKDRVVEPDHLLVAVRTVAAGGSFIDDVVVDALVAARSRGVAASLDRLTPREDEILQEIAKGRSNAAIAAELGISGRAVEKHVSAIFTKLDLLEDRATHRRVQAALLALRERSP